MTLRTRLFVIISLVVLIILAISVGIIVMVRKQKAAETATPTTEQTGTTDTGVLPAQITPKATTIPAGVTVKPASSEEALKNGAKQMAKIFTERYGTYSSDSNFANIKEVESIVTGGYWAELEKKIGVGKPAMFIGVTTVAVTSEVLTYENGSATVEVSALRTTTRGSETTDSNEKAKVGLTLSKGSWLVDSFEWVK